MVAFAEEQHSSVQTVYSPVKQAKPAVPQNVADIEETILPQPEAIRIKIKDKWLQLSKEFVASHPGGSVITQYKYVRSFIGLLCDVRTARLIICASL